jgi:hypothetical protein
MQPEPAGWTLESLRALVDTKFEHMKAEVDAVHRQSEQRFTDMDRAVSTALTAQEKAVAAALAAAEKAVGKAEVASEKRLDSVNEFRAQQTEILAQTMPRVEAEARFTQLAEKISEQAAQTAKDIKSATTAMWAALGTITMLALVVAGIYFSNR